MILSLVLNLFTIFEGAILINLESASLTASIITQSSCPSAMNYDAFGLQSSAKLNLKCFKIGLEHRKLIDYH